jgi:hypothetical protein
MAILTQLLLVSVALAALYASFVHNRDKYEKTLAILPDFSKLFKQAPAPYPYVKLVVSVPDRQSETVRRAIARAGGGVVGEYTWRSFSSQGIGRYKPEHGANPMVDTEEAVETIEQERIEVTCLRHDVPQILAAIKEVHPYEETLVDIYQLEPAHGPEAAHGHAEPEHGDHH